MLKSLSIQNIAVIEKVSIDFGEGFHVLTGETGAGKSIIIDSINAVLGFRTSRDLVRKGADYAVVVAQFSDLSSAVTDFLASRDIVLENEDLLLHRKITADGKSSCRINDKPVTAATMKQLGELLVNIHGQHDSQKLLNAGEHYLYIDQMLGDNAVFSDYQRAYGELVRIIKKRKALTIDEDEKRKRTEQLRFEIDQIEAAAIRVGEKEELLAKKKLCNELAQITEALSEMHYQLDGDDDEPGAMGRLSQSLALLSTLPQELFSSLSSSLLAADEALKTAFEEVNAKLEEVTSQSLSPDEIEQRLSVYYDFSKRYGNSEEEILVYLEKAKEELKSIEFADKEREALEAAFVEKKEETYRLAQALSAARKKTARDFEKAVISQLQFLNMPYARFRVDFQDGPITKTGIDTIEFLICLNPGETLKPLKSVASGGELSRIMLAFRAVLGQKESVPTLIFDEIDTGISGLAAGKVALKLKEVSRSAQVICVTHLAQIAAAATAHFLIEKQVIDDRTYTDVRRLDFEGRKQELARIMGGFNVNELMLANAQQMLKEYNT